MKQDLKREEEKFKIFNTSAILRHRILSKQVKV